MTAQPIETVATEATAPQHGAEVIVPLNRLKASPKNARKTPHSPATIEAFAASIKAKGVLQPPVVEIERDGEGVPTGNYLVTIGEGRRQGLRLLAKRKAIKRTHPVRVIVDDENDAHEISLDENITREAMHPADQFEAFQRLAVEKGYGPEEIGARFGVSAHVVRQRLRLAAAAPELMTAYREGTLALDQLTAFCVSEDQDRQRQVLAQIGPHTPAYAIRRAMTEAKVRVDDRRVRFVGVEAYEAAGGPVLRDLFTEDGGGWLEDAGLLDRLVSDKLAGLADEAREREGWKLGRTVRGVCRRVGARAGLSGRGGAVGCGRRADRGPVGRVRPARLGDGRRRYAAARGGRPAGGDRQGPSGLRPGLRLRPRNQGAGRGHGHARP